MSTQAACQSSCADRRAPSSGLADLVSGLIGRAVTTLLDWQERASQRRDLRSFGPHMLKDLGLDPADVEREVSKPFWRV